MVLNGGWAPAARRGSGLLACLARSGSGLFACIAVAAAVALSVAPASAHAWPGVVLAGDSLSSTMQSALVDARRATRSPGVSAAVVERGRLVWAGATGCANWPCTRRLTISTPFITASTAKSVAAAMVMQLVDAGVVRLDDRMSKWVPDLPGARRFTVRQVLSHTSGLNDYDFDSDRLADLAERQPYRTWRRSEIYRTARQIYPPGTDHEYSNTGYVALGGLIERAAGAGVEETFRSKVAGPLGLERSSWAYRPELTNQIALPYRLGSGGRITSTLPRAGRIPSVMWGEVFTDGGFATTPAELALINNAQYTGGLLSPRSRRALTTWTRFRSGLGTWPKDWAGVRWVGHDGWYDGYESESWTDRETGTTIVVFTNLQERDGQDTTSWRAWKRVEEAWDSWASE